ncbi:MAG TPA: BlaI/MecI/CopY family transcriptional regulator [bacterium]|nr:BlaI/MecI/CopY family transcriptional regulator [bacterium]
MKHTNPKLVLAELETLVMKEVWKRGRATVHEVRGALRGKRDLAYTTILTTLRNLEKKGFLAHEVDGRSHVYVPRVEEGAVRQSTLRTLLDNLFDGSKVRLVQTLFEEEPLSPEEYESLRRTIRALRGKDQKDD